MLEDIGIRTLANETLVLANGNVVHRRKGAALFRLGEHVGGSDVLFGAKGDMALLGELTLTALGLFLHPLSRELKPLPLTL